MLQIALHKVGNKTNDEGYFLSDGLLHLDDELDALLQTYFLSPFKFDTLYEFHHETQLSLNEVYTYVQQIFADPETLHEQSRAIAKHLYQKSIHPKVKGGELYVVYFPDYAFQGENVPAVGIFKSENKDVFLKVHPKNENFSIEKQEGVNINKLDKGSLIIKRPQDEQPVVAVVDNLNKSSEAQYWFDEFLKVQQQENEYFHTAQTLSMYKNFVMQDLPEAFEISRADQADLLNRSVQYFKEHESFSMDEFEQEVMAQPDIIDRFAKYKESYENQYEVQIENEFDISDAALKKQARNFKSIIKLDKNFHIYIHGDRSQIEQGIDEEGRKYYKIFYEVEQ